MERSKDRISTKISNRARQGSLSSPYALIYEDESSTAAADRFKDYLEAADADEEDGGSAARLPSSVNDDSRDDSYPTERTRSVGLSNEHLSP